MTSGLEKGDRFPQHSERPSLRDSIFDHLVVSPIFIIGLASNPRQTLKAIRDHGIQEIGRGYKIFYNNARPSLYYGGIKH